MYELIQVSPACYYIQSPAKVGVVLTGENEVCLIDSGSDKDAGKKVLRVLQSQGWTLKAIYNTHSHADHIGGNRDLQTQTGCAIYAPPVERAFTQHPVLEPTFLYGGNPPSALRHKFMMAQESDALPLTADVLPAGWEIVPLPGHSFSMVGFRTPDGVVYLADCLSSDATLEKYKICFLVDPAQYVATLESVKMMEASLFVPSHAEPASEIAPLAKRNIDAVRAVARTLVALCETPLSFDELLQRVFDVYGLTMTFEQHALVGSTVRSYLSWLTGSGKLEMTINNNRLVWKRA